MLRRDNCGDDLGPDPLGHCFFRDSGENSMRYLRLEQLAHFEAQRETNIEYLRGLPAGTGDRRAFHKEAGEITLAQMLHEWALHDLGHIRQIAELVRARRCRAGAGPLGESYQLKP